MDFHEVREWTITLARWTARNPTWIRQLRQMGQSMGMSDALTLTQALFQTQFLAQKLAPPPSLQQVLDYERQQDICLHTKESVRRAGDGVQTNMSWQRHQTVNEKRAKLRAQAATATSSSASSSNPTTASSSATATTATRNRPLPIAENEYYNAQNEMEWSDVASDVEEFSDD
eukprot:5113945-Amphidinium_carterae.2